MGNGERERESGHAKNRMCCEGGHHGISGRGEVSSTCRVRNTEHSNNRQPFATKSITQMVRIIKKKIQELTFPQRGAMTERSKSLPPAVTQTEVRCISLVVGEKMCLFCDLKHQKKTLRK